MHIKKRTIHLTIAIVSFLVGSFFSAGYDKAIIEYWHYGSSNIREALHTLYRDRVFNMHLAFIDNLRKNKLEND